MSKASTTSVGRNKFEKDTYKFLLKTGMDFKYEARKIPYVLACHYTPDWEIKTPNGSILVETKGYFRPQDKRKLAAVKRQHPGLDIRIVFYKDVKSYTKWAEKNGFKWAVGTIPQEWLDGL